MIGESIAHYKITEEIGEGSMGEAYRARDTKLNRDVALKILPQVFAQDSQRMARFEREAPNSHGPSSHLRLESTVCAWADRKRPVLENTKT